MGGHGLAGLLWFLAAISVLAVTQLDADNVVVAAAAMAGTIVAIGLGYLLTYHPSAVVVRWSSIAGVAWVTVSAALVAGHAADAPAASFVAALGGAACVIARLPRLAPPSRPARIDPGIRRV